MQKLDLYVASLLILAVSVYLKSPVVSLGAVILWGIVVAENILTKAAKEAEIMALVARAESYEKKLKVLEMELLNVAERAKTILGEHF